MKRKASSSDGGVIVERDMLDPSSVECIRNELQRSASFGERKCSSLSDDTTSADLATDNNEDVPIMIRPSFELTNHSFVRAISVDEPEPHDRALYLRDFLPPDPATSPRVERPTPFQCNIGHSDGGDLYPCSFVEV